MKYDNYVRLEVLTPVYIGSGDTSDPLDYIITSKDGVDYFCQIDLDAWLEDYPEQEELSKILDSGQLSKIRKYIADHLDADIYARTRSRVISPEIGTEYRKHIDNLKSPNQLLIDQALKNPLTGGLLIPGSSIKGAMRTAVIDWCDCVWNLDLKNSRTPRDYTQALERALGTIRDSAFKQLKIGDFEAVNSQGAVITAKEKSIKPEKIGGTPKNRCEICLSSATEGKPQELFSRFAIGRQDLTQDSFLTCSMGNRSQRWSLTELMALVSDFYRQRYQKEKNKFYSQKHFTDSSEVIRMLDQHFASLQENQMILRVGHYSHIEAMTITNNKPVGKKGYGKTRTLADGIYPFGWVKLSMCSQEEYQQYWQHKSSIDAEHDSQRQQLRQEKIVLRQEQMRQQLEQQEKQQEAERQRLTKEKDELENPWKKVVRQLDQLKSWGDLKQQILEEEALAAFRHVEDFTQGVFDLAVSVRNNARKWDGGRDELLAEWFEPTAQQWLQQTEEVDSNSQLGEQEQLDVAAVSTLRDWGEYKTSGMELSLLSLPALEALKGQFESWGCGAKRAKKDKQKAWKLLQKTLAQKLNG